MSQNAKNAAAIFIVFILIAVIYQVHEAFVRTDLYEAGREQSYIPTITQLQQALIDTGNPRYDVGPKGADGDPGTDTLRAWKNWSFDIYANGGTK